MTPLFEIRDLTHFYGSTRALSGVTMSIPHGAIGLVGQNGAGKSTIIQIMLGLIRPTDGTATVMGLSIPRQAVELRTRVGYMSERDAIVPGLSGLEYVALAGELSGMPRRQALRRAHESLSYLDLEDARYRKIEQYSQGMTQRLKLAASLVHDPDLLLLDEPTAGLDPEGRKNMLDLLRGFASRGDKSVLLSTHLLTDIERACDTAIILDNGELRGVGNIDQLRSKQAQRYHIRCRGNVAAFATAMNQAEYVVGREQVPGGDRVPSGEKAPIPKQAATPEQVRSSNQVPGSERAPGDLVRMTIEIPPQKSTVDLFALATQLQVVISELEPDEENLDSVYHRLISEGI